MLLDRRSFIGISAAAIAGSTLFPPESKRAKIRAVLFDAFPIFDPKPVFTLVNEIVPDKGPDLSNLWRTKQFEYTWLRACGNRYRDFWQVTEDALVFSAGALKVDLSSGHRASIMDKFLELPIHPDVLPTLDALKKTGIKVGFLSNFTNKMLESSSRKSGLDGLIDYVISTDEAKTYKPASNAYELGPDRTGLRKDEIVFVAFAPWDAVGASWYGYPTYWANRQNQPLDILDAGPITTHSDLSGLASFVR